MNLSFFYILLIAIALGIDAFSVALSLGVYSCVPVQVFRVSAHFGFFQFFMPLVGFFLGNNMVQFIRKYDHWVAFGILFLVGLHMLKESFKKEEEDEEKIKCERTGEWALLGLSIATSIDALAVGLSLGISGGNILFPCIIIGVVAAVMTMVGMYIGNRCSVIFGKRMETVGAIVLLLLSLKMLTI